MVADKPSAPEFADTIHYTVTAIHFNSKESKIVTMNKQTTKEAISFFNKSEIHVWYHHWSSSSLCNFGPLNEGNFVTPQPIKNYFLLIYSLNKRSS